MKILMLNTFDDLAGADRAARRLQQGLRESGVAASLLVQFRFGEDKDILCSASWLTKQLRSLKLFLGTLPVRLYPQRPVNNFTPALLPDRLPAQVERIAPDLVHLHWLGAGFCRVETIGKFDQPLVWTLHDSWPFTGGCHIPGTCLKYREACGACPVLGSSRERDLSRWTWKRKKKSWQNLPLTVVAPSHWLADCVRSSSLFGNLRVEVIPNGIDTEKFQPMDKISARKRLGLPQDRPIVLFGAVNALTDPNKGWHLLQAALKVVGVGRPDVLAVVFGADAPATLPDLGMTVVYLGRLDDEEALVAAYSAADVFVAPSLQESFCQTLVEAMACATPVVAFKATGPLDIVEHRHSGYLVQPYESSDLASGIFWVLEDKGRHAELSQQARQKVMAEFGIEKVATQYISLYREILASWQD